MSMPEIERIETIVHGTVQMVMYRDFTQRKASGLKLVGEVQNMQDGTVKVIAEGSRVQLERLVAKLHKGSLLSHVEKVEVVWKPATGHYKDFKINYER
jgi:acylphosphatase